MRCLSLPTMYICYAVVPLVESESCSLFSTVGPPQLIHQEFIESNCMLR